MPGVLCRRLHFFSPYISAILPLLVGVSSDYPLPFTPIEHV